MYVVLYKNKEEVKLDIYEDADKVKIEKALQENQFGEGKQIIEKIRPGTLDDIPLDATILILRCEVVVPEVVQTVTVYSIKEAIEAIGQVKKV
jgi:hypothetical protein